MTHPGGITFTNCGRGPPGYIMNCPGEPAQGMHFTRWNLEVSRGAVRLLSEKAVL